MKNQIKNQITITLLLVFLLVLTACTGTQQTQITTSGFIGGTEGVVASFQTDEPQAKVLDSGLSPFRVTLLLENKGEHPLQAGDILTTMDSIDYNAFQIKNPNAKNDMLVQGITRDTTGKSVIGDKYPGISYEASFKDKVPAPQSYTIGMNICYKYGTETLSKACLRKEVTARTTTKDICKIEDKRAVSNSGAPLQVTAISERPSGKNQITLVFELENKGKGEVYDNAFLSKGKCVSDPNSALLNKVHVKVFFEENKPAVKCTQFANSNEGTLRLVQNKQRFDCTIDTTGLQDTLFERLVNVNIDYVYKDYISKQIIVDKSV